MTDIKVSYKYGNQTLSGGADAKPINAGTYVCKATIGGVTAQLEFTIAKAESNPVAQDYDTYYGKKHRT